MHQTTTDIEHQVIKMLDVAKALSSHSHHEGRKVASKNSVITNEE